MYSTQITASYQMKNTLTGQIQGYYIFRKTANVSDDMIVDKFIKDIASFPSYTSGIMVVCSDIIITDYKNRILKTLKTALLY